MRTKLEKIRGLLAEHNLKGILIESQPNFHWLTGGRSFIGLNSEMACASLLVTGENTYLVSNNIESHRLLSEEIPEDLKLLEFPWHNESQRIKQIQSVCGDNFCSDSRFTADFVKFRTVFDDHKVAVYRSIAPCIAAILEQSMLKLRPGISELELAGIISDKLWAIGVEPVTLLIGFDERILNWRHPLPTSNALRQQALGAVAVRYKGIFVSATRQICIGKLPNETAEKHKAVCAVDSQIMFATKAGATMDNLFNVLVEAYKSAGYPDEWKNHHQGGLTGYVSRESKAMPGNMLPVCENQAFAWNPTIRGTKSEDTMLLINGKPEIVTHTGSWEYADYNGLLRPVIKEI